MVLTIEELCNGLDLTWEEINNTTATPDDVKRLDLRHIDAKYARV